MLLAAESIESQAGRVAKDLLFNCARRRATTPATSVIVGARPIEGEEEEDEEDELQVQLYGIRAAESARTEAHGQ